MRHRSFVTHAALLTLALFCIATHAQTQATGTVSKVWVADKGDGTYKNPIIHADFSDPDAVRVGDDFYMTASSFNAAPGLPILQSKDLVNWSLVGYHFTPGFAAHLGYRALHVDFDEGSGNDRLAYDLSMYGPIIGVSFSF